MKNTAEEIRISGHSFARSITRLARYDDISEVMTNLAAMLKRSLKCRWVVVYRLDADDGGFRPMSGSGLTPSWEKRFSALQFLPMRQPLSRHLLTKRRCQRIENPGSSPLLSTVMQNLLRGFSLFVVPMLVRGHVTGAVMLARPRSSIFTAAESAIARDLVAQASLVADHLRLLDDSLDMALEVAKRVDIILMLDDVNKAISSSLSLDRIAATAIERIEGVVQSDLQALLEVKGDDFVVLASRSETLALPEGINAGSVIAGTGVFRRAARSGKPQCLQNMTLSARMPVVNRELVTAGIKSLLLAPIIGSQGVRGLLLLGDRREDGFCGEENFAVGKIAAQLAVAMENARLFDEMRLLFFNTISSLTNAIDAKSPWTKGHSERVMQISATIAGQMGMHGEDLERVRLAALLHDVGKIGIIEALLEKPAELTVDEFPPLRLHPEKGVAILEPIAQLQHVLPGILHHHEWFDGSGYPVGLSGDAIPIDSRIIAVADSFDAMIADRPYRKGLQVAKAVQELVRCSGSQFDPEVVDCFRHHLARVTKDPTLAEGVILEVISP